MTSIHAVDYQTGKVLTSIENKEGSALFWDDPHVIALKDNVETFNFTMQATVSAAKHFSKKNLVVIPDEDGHFREFIIRETFQYSHKKDVITISSHTEIAKDKILPPLKRAGQSIETSVDHILDGLKWEAGVLEYTGSRTIEWTEYTNALEALKYIANLFGLEMRFRVEIRGNEVVGRYVDMVEKVGNDNNKEIVLGKDLIGVKRREISDVVTALVGLGPERPNGSRIVVYVEDEEALDRWGRGTHLWDTYEPQVDGENVTEAQVRSLTQEELKKRSTSAVTYEADIVSIESVFGFKHEKTRIGDTVRVKDTYYSPPLYLDARVIEVSRYVSTNAKKTYILGDFIEYREEDVMKAFKQLKAQLKSKVSMTESDTPPENPYHNQLWIDTSDPDQDIWKRWDMYLEIWKEGPGGPQGIRGPEGPAGTSVVKVEEYYLVSPFMDGIVKVTPGWSTEIPTMTATNKYLWNYEKIIFSDGSTRDTSPVIMGVYGDSGNTGRSIVSIKEYYLVSELDSDITRETSGWSSEMQKTTPEKRYLWNYEEVTWSSGQILTYIEPIIIGVQGEDAWSVEVISSNGNIFKESNINTVLEARVYRGGKDLTDTIPASKFKWKRVSEDPLADLNWTMRYFSGTKTITVTTEDVYRRATFFCEVIE